MAYLFIILVKFYRYALSPLMPKSCRYFPSCSEYSIEAFQKKGALKGILLTIKRLLKCHPFSKGGYDPLI